MNSEKKEQFVNDKLSEVCEFINKLNYDEDNLRNKAFVNILVSLLANGVNSILKKDSRQDFLLYLENHLKAYFKAFDAEDENE